MPVCPMCANSDVTLHTQAKDIEYYSTDETFNWWRCASCDVLFIDPMPVDRLDQIYPPNYYSFAPGKRTIATAGKEIFDKARFRRLTARIEKDEISALDVGGGSGWLLDLVKSVDPRVKRTAIVDLGTEAKAAAEKKGHRYFAGRIEDYDGGEQLDFVLLLNLIEHVPDPRAVLRKVRGLLAPGGVLFVQTPNFDALDERLFRKKSWAGYHTPRHFVLFTKPSLEKLCRECGFTVEESVYVQGAPFWAVSVLDLLRRAGLARIDAQRPAIYHPLMPLLQVGFAAFDILRSPFSKLSQMGLVLRPGD